MGGVIDQMVEEMRPPPGRQPDDELGFEDLLDLEPDEFRGVDLLSAITAVTKAEAMLHAVRLELMRAYADDPDRVDGGEFAADEIAAAARTSLRRTDADLLLAGNLTRLPRTWENVKSGRLDRTRAWQIADATRVLTDDQCTLVEERLFPECLNKSPRQLRDLVNRTVIAVDPNAATQRAAERRKERRVSTEPDADGMGWLNAYLAAPDLAAIADRVDVLARAAVDADEPRSMDQRRADVLRDLLLGSNNEHVRAHVYVTVTAETLLGLRDLPGDVQGNGVVPADQVRELAGQLYATWSGLLTDENGHVLNLSDERYRFRGRIAEYIRVRDRVCCHPGCHKPAERSDVDHRVPYPSGPTAAGNGDTLCRRHHRMKHHTAWRTTRRPDGSVEWRHPDGVVQINQPETVPVATAAAP